MRYINYFLYFIIFITFGYIIFNLNESILSISIVLTNFFANLFPYLFMFLILNQLLIRTNIIYFIGYLLQFIFYPLFKINAKSASLILLSILNGFPSSCLYSSTMIKENKIDILSSQKIANYFFLPSFTFIFYVVKNSININFFILLTISLYIPPFVLMLISKNTRKDEYIPLTIVKKELINNSLKFNATNSLKSIFSDSIYVLITILGMISFCSMISLIIPNTFIKGLLEFSIPSINILKSNIPIMIKTMCLLIILSFSSLSSIFQASIYLDDLNMSLFSFIKIRIVMVSLSLLTYAICLNFFYQLFL